MSLTQLKSLCLKLGLVNPVPKPLILVFFVLQRRRQYLSPFYCVTICAPSRESTGNQCHFSSPPVDMLFFLLFLRKWFCFIYCYTPGPKIHKCVVIKWTRQMADELKSSKKRQIKDEVGLYDKNRAALNSNIMATCLLLWGELQAISHSMVVSWF